jgi:hypothetical protein
MASQACRKSGTLQILLQLSAAISANSLASKRAAMLLARHS